MKLTGKRKLEKLELIEVRDQLNLGHTFFEKEERERCIE